VTAKEDTSLQVVATILEKNGIKGLGSHAGILTMEIVAYSSRSEFFVNGRYDNGFSEQQL